MREKRRELVDKQKSFVSSIMQFFKNQVNLMVRFLFPVQRSSGSSGFSCSRKSTFKKRFDLWNLKAELPTLKVCPLAVRVQRLPEVSQVTVPSFCEESCISIQEPQHMQGWWKCRANLDREESPYSLQELKRYSNLYLEKFKWKKNPQKNWRQTWSYAQFIVILEL